MTAKDTYGYLGCERLQTTRLLSSLVEALESVLAHESEEAVERARKLLDEVRPAIDRAAEEPAHLKEIVAQHPLLALGVAAMAGFTLASLRRR